MKWWRLLLIIVICFGGGSVRAQSLKSDDGILHWEAGMNVGLNNDGYEIELRAAYFPLQYVGVKFGLGMAGEIESFEDWGKEDWETVHEYASRFKFTPSVVVRTPRLIHLKNQGGGFYLFAEPGMVFSPGASGSRNARWLRWDLKTGINFQIDRYIVTIGYGVSNFSLYSGNPVSQYGVQESRNYITHSGFIGGAVKF